MKRWLSRYWGYVLIAVVVTAWSATKVDPLIVSAGFLVGLVYMMFLAPVWCGAETRTGERCRKNALGVLLGCSYRQHKWQKIRHLPELTRSVATNASNFLASIVGAVAVVGGLIAAIQGALT
jgi:hypothetical protein